MVDFVKVHLAGAKIYHLANSELEFVGNYSLSTGETNIGRKIQADYYGLKVIIYPNEYVELQGSLHKFWNNGLHNWNDFHHSDLIRVLDGLEETLGLNLDDCIIKNIEFGVNLRPPVATKLILDGLLHHKQKAFKSTLVRGPGYIKQVAHERYRIKAYDKRMQYLQLGFSLPNEIFRFELSHKKMIDVNSLGVVTLNDLRGTAWLVPILKRLQQVWSEVFMYDYTLRTENLRPYQRATKIHQWQNVNYWRALPKQLRYKQRTQYDQCIMNNSEQLQKQIKSQMAKKWNDLSKNGLPINQKESMGECLPINTSGIQLDSIPLVVSGTLHLINIRGEERWFTKVYNSREGRIGSQTGDLISSQ